MFSRKLADLSLRVEECHHAAGTQPFDLSFFYGTNQKLMVWYYSFILTLQRSKKERKEKEREGIPGPG